MPLEAGKAIGVLDSGVGGLTVVNEICSLLPYENMVYFGDTARMPYGPRSSDEVRGFAMQIIEFLQTQEIKLVVVACNSATAAGLSYYQEHCDLPVIGVIEPGVRAALRYTRNGKIGVIGTTGTIGSLAYQKTLERENGDLHIITRACPLFVLLVENDLVNTPEAARVAHEYLDPLREAEIDTLILGCTHYPFMMDLIQDAVGSGVKLISSAEETAIDVKNILSSRNLLNPLADNEPAHRFFVSARAAPFEEVGAKMLRRPIRAYQVVF